MPNPETIRNILVALQLIVVAIGLILAVRQLRLLTQQYRDLHDWNRRRASQEALNAWATMSKDN